MTSHSYLDMIPEGNVQNGTLTSNNRTLDQLVVGEKIWFQNESGFGSYPPFAVEIEIEQRHIDNVFELFYDLTNLFLTANQDIINWLEGERTGERPVVVQHMIKVLERYENYNDDWSDWDSLLDHCYEMRSHLCVPILDSKWLNDDHTESNGEHHTVSYLIKDSEIWHWFGVMIVLFGRTEKGKKLNKYNINWYGEDFTGVNGSDVVRVDSITGKRTRKEKVKLEHELFKLFKTYKNDIRLSDRDCEGEDMLKLTESILDKMKLSDPDRESKLRKIYNKALKKADVMNLFDKGIRSFISPEAVRKLSEYGLDQNDKRFVKPYSKTSEKSGFYITLIPSQWGTRTEYFKDHYEYHNTFGHRFIDIDVLHWLRFNTNAFWGHGTNPFKKGFDQFTFVIRDHNGVVVGGNVENKGY